MYVVAPPDWVVWAFLWQLVGIVLFPIVLFLHAISESGKRSENSGKFFLAWIVICFWPLGLAGTALLCVILLDKFGLL